VDRLARIGLCKGGGSERRRTAQRQYASTSDHEACLPAVIIVGRESTQFSRRMARGAFYAAARCCRSIARSSSSTVGALGQIRLRPRWRPRCAAGAAPITASASARAGAIGGWPAPAARAICPRRRSRVFFLRFLTRLFGDPAPARDEGKKRVRARRDGERTCAGRSAAAGLAQADPPIAPARAEALAVIVLHLLRSRGRHRGRRRSGPSAPLCSRSCAMLPQHLRGGVKYAASGHPGEKLKLAFTLPPTIMDCGRHALIARRAYWRLRCGRLRSLRPCTDLSEQADPPDRLRIPGGGHDFFRAVSSAPKMAELIGSPGPSSRTSPCRDQSRRRLRARRSPTATPFCSAMSHFRGQPKPLQEASIRGRQGFRADLADARFVTVLLVNPNKLKANPLPT